MSSSPAVQDLYPDDFAHCYGCGRHNTAGYQIKTYPANSTTVTDFAPAGHHTAGIDSVYGGLIASVIDCHSTGSAAIFWMQANGMEIGAGPAVRFVTARLEVDYLAPTPLAPLHLTGSATEVGARKVVVATELETGGVVTAKGRAVLVKVPEAQSLPR
jgi:acyl-coenzyme A thioesterase PaaI-like protein